MTEAVQLAIVGGISTVAAIFANGFMLWFQTRYQENIRQTQTKKNREELPQAIAEQVVQRVRTETSPVPPPPISPAQIPIAERITPREVPDKKRKP